MKANTICILAVLAMFGSFIGLFYVPAVGADVTLEVLNPRGEVTPIPILAPSARIPDISGKKIGIYWNNKAGGDHFWDVVEAEMKHQAPTVKIVRYSGPFEPSDEQIAAMTKEVDAFFYGVGD